MNVSLQWIEELTGLSGLDGDETFRRVTLHTAEVDRWTDMAAALRGVVIGEVLTCEKHPRADKLTVNTVSVGGEVLQIVCGAPNARAGMKTAVALSGTVVGGMTIKKTKLRGVESCGMMCAEDELGLSDDHEGVMELASDAPTGQPLAEYLGRTGAVLEVDNHGITHRPDLWGHVGWAREIAAQNGVSFDYPYDLGFDYDTSGGVTVNIADPDLCPRYTMTVVEGVEVKPSPPWMRQRLEQCGVRAINNIVDITNYVMLEHGEPLHAFDRDRLTGTTVTVRRARTGETIETIDHVDRELDDGMLVIADEAGPIALAGVMGGAATEVGDTTTRLVLEAANFNRAVIREARKKTGLQSEATNRFEKGLVPELTAVAMNRIVALIRESCPGARVVDACDAGGTGPETTAVRMHKDAAARISGMPITAEETRRLLAAVGCTVHEAGDDFQVDVPFWRRRDLSIQEDLVEEVSRLYGYERVSERATEVPLEPAPINRRRRRERRIKEELAAAGLNELYNYHFIGRDLLRRFGLPDDGLIEVENAIDKTMDCMRTTALPQLLQAVQRNLHHTDAAAVYELGRVYRPDPSAATGSVESDRLSGMVWARGDSEPFYRAKAHVRRLLSAMRLPFKWREAADLPPYAHPGRSLALAVAGQPAGFVSEVHPRIAARFDVDLPVGMFDLDMDALAGATAREITYTDISRYPAVHRDLALLVDEKTRSADVVSLARRAGSLVRAVELFDEFTGGSLPAGKKNLAYRLTLQAPDRTLPEDEINGVMETILDLLRQNGIELRS